jgi:hypothetical protein
MTESRFPAGWDEERVKRLIAHDESMAEDEQVAEDEAAAEEKTYTMHGGVSDPYDKLLEAHGLCVHTRLPVEGLKERLETSGFQSAQVVRKTPETPTLLYVSLAISTTAAALQIADILFGWFKQTRQPIDKSKADTPQAKLEVKGRDAKFEITGTEDNYKELIRILEKAISRRKS